MRLRHTFRGELCHDHSCFHTNSSTISHWTNSESTSSDERGVSIPTALVAPISTLSSHLASLSQSLPGPVAATLYRRISSTWGGVILQRRVLQRGIGRLSLVEAKIIVEECLLWIQACKMTMGRSVRRVEGPWARLLDAMKLLTLEQDQFRIAVDRIFNTDADGLEKLRDDLEVSQLDLGELIEVVRLREDCWR